MLCPVGSIVHGELSVDHRVHDASRCAVRFVQGDGESFLIENGEIRVQSGEPMPVISVNAFL